MQTSPEVPKMNKPEPETGMEDMPSPLQRDGEQRESQEIIEPIISLDGKVLDEPVYNSVQIPLILLFAVRVQNEENQENSLLDDYKKFDVEGDIKYYGEYAEFKVRSQASLYWIQHCAEMYFSYARVNPEILRQIYELCDLENKEIIKALRKDEDPEELLKMLPTEAIALLNKVLDGIELVDVKEEKKREKKEGN